MGRRIRQTDPDGMSSTQRDIQREAKLMTVWRQTDTWGHPPVITDADMHLIITRHLQSSKRNISTQGETA